jgi:Replication initiator protein, pSAM2
MMRRSHPPAAAHDRGPWRPPRPTHAAEAKPRIVYNACFYPQRCAVWLLYGIQPHGATSKTQPGRCKGRADRRTTLGLPGRRVLVSRKWSGKTLADHRTDRKRFVLDTLAAIGVQKAEPDPARLIWQKVQPGDPNLPPRAHRLMHAIAERIRWRAEYDKALLAAGTPPPDLSATQPHAA